MHLCKYLRHKKKQISIWGKKESHWITEGEIKGKEGKSLQNSLSSQSHIKIGNSFDNEMFKIMANRSC